MLKEIKNDFKAEFFAGYPSAAAPSAPSVGGGGHHSPSSTAAAASAAAAASLAAGMATIVSFLYDFF